jgi:hypothetical protein
MSFDGMDLPGKTFAQEFGQNIPEYLIAALLGTGAGYLGNEYLGLPEQIAYPAGIAGGLYLGHKALQKTSSIDDKINDISEMLKQFSAEHEESKNMMKELKDKLEDVVEMEIEKDGEGSRIVKVSNMSFTNRMLMLKLAAMNMTDRLVERLRVQKEQELNANRDPIADAPKNAEEMYRNAYELAHSMNNLQRL